MTTDKKNPLGPTGSRVQANLARIREFRGLTKKQLSARVGDLGRPIPPLGISRIEAGTRRVDVDDLVALAVALNVSPLALLMPPEEDREVTDLVGEVTTDAESAWRWMRGYQAIGEDGGEADERQQEDYERLSLSFEDWKMRRHDAGRALNRLDGDVRGLIRLASLWGSGVEEQFRSQARVVRADIEALPAEVDRIEADRAENLRLRDERRAREGER